MHYRLSKHILCNICCTPDVFFLVKSVALRSGVRVSRARGAAYGDEPYYYRCSTNSSGSVVLKVRSY